MSSARILLRGALVCLLCWFGAAAGAQRVDAIELPPGFSEQVVASGLNQATNIAFAPDGRMFIAEKAGRVRVVTAGGQLLPDPVVDISAHVNTAVERGLLGIAVDSDFATNGYLWLLYNFEHEPGNAAAFEGPKTSRLSRVTVRADNTVESPDDPETVVLGKDVAPCLPPAFAPGSTADCIPAHAITHTIGTVKSAPDGTLWVGSGDNSTHQDRVPSHLWTQRDDVLTGKILRVDRTGHGLPNHPFCPGEADLTKPCTKVYAKGLRNPFRFTLRDGAGPIVGDVGWGAHEELNLVRAGGNYGWPCYEGPGKSPWEWDPACQPLYQREGTNLAAIPPAWSLSHGLRPDPVDPRWTSNGASIVGGPLLTSPNYPSEWRGRVFVGDYARSWLAALRVVAPDTLDPAPTRFALDLASHVDLQQGPDGNLHYVSLSFAGASSSVRRIVYAPGNGVPVPRAKATPTSGRAPLTVQFDGSESTDPEGEPLTHRWEFGDGATSTAISPSHTYTVPGTYTAKLIVDDGRGRNPADTVMIGVDNTPPRLTVAAPAPGGLFRVGRDVRLRATWADDEETTFPGSRIRWTVNLHHRDHIHPRGEFVGGDVAFTAADDHDADSHYVITATATDSGGLSDSTTFEIHPRTTPLSVRSDPPGGA
ncbi:MAG: PQQ-dependent sugar dehydrogenase, partial [Baekduiaceae bacterium]